MSKRKRIEKLTDAQIARMVEFRDQWIEIGLSTEPADRPRAEAAIRECYRAGGLEPPRYIVWCGSPLSNGLTRAIVLQQGEEIGNKLVDSVRGSVWAIVGVSVGGSVGGSVWDSVGDSVWASVGDSVADSVGDSLRDSVGASVRDSVRASVRDSVADSVGNSVADSVRASVADSVRASVRDSVADSVGNSVADSVGDSVADSVRASVGASVRDSVVDSGYGQHDANWLAHLAYFREVCGLKKQTDKARGLTELAKAAGWWLPHQNICWVSERHNLLRRDERGLLHSVAGPALTYPDGWAIYAVHGVRIPAEWIENKATLDPSLALTWHNVEQRRALAELIGWDRILDKVQARTLHKDKWGELIAAEIPDSGTEHFVRVVCGTGRRLVIGPVDKSCRSALDAVAWTYQVTPEQYAQLEARS